MNAPQPDDLLYLRHILDAINQIEEYLSGVSREIFGANRLLQDGVIRQLQIIGEAAKRVSAQTKTRASTVPWQKITGMRDKLTHDYLGVDLDIVWETTRTSLLPLKQAVTDLLA